MVKNHIDFNSDKRKHEKKIFLKLIINRVYGKTMENLIKRINVRLVNNAEDYEKYESKPSFL